MAERWSPTLQVSEVGEGCRLTLAGFAYGDGATLQEAADDLVARLLNIAMCFRSSGWAKTTELVPDMRWLDFVWELGEIAARGGDIRERIFGLPGALEAIE
jgi:hypothetical protein